MGIREHLHFLLSKLLQFTIVLGSSEEQESQRTTANNNGEGLGGWGRWHLWSPVRLITKKPTVSRKNQYQAQGFSSDEETVYFIFHYYWGLTIAVNEF